MKANMMQSLRDFLEKQKGVNRNSTSPFLVGEGYMLFMVFAYEVGINLQDTEPQVLLTLPRHHT